MDRKQVLSLRNQMRGFRENTDELREMLRTEKAANKDVADYLATPVPGAINRMLNQARSGNKVQVLPAGPGSAPGTTVEPSLP